MAWTYQFFFRLTCLLIESLGFHDNADGCNAGMPAAQDCLSHPKITFQHNEIYNLCAM